MITTDLAWKSFIPAQFSAEPRRGERPPSQPENLVVRISKYAQLSRSTDQSFPLGERGTLGIFGWGFTAGTLEPLAYTRDSSIEYRYLY